MSGMTPRARSIPKPAKKTPGRRSKTSPPPSRAGAYDTPSSGSEDRETLASEQTFSGDVVSKPTKLPEDDSVARPLSSAPSSNASVDNGAMNTNLIDDMQPTSEESGVQVFQQDTNGSQSTFYKVTEETVMSPHYAELMTRDTDATFTESDYLLYKLENAIAANPAVRFYILLGISLVSCLVMALVWVIVAGTDDDHENTNDPASAIFMTFQVLITGGYDDSIQETSQRLAFFVTILVGVSIVSILIGLISDTVNEYMEALSSGSSKVAEEGHTLILGWNQATTRMVCQIAFLRRIFIMQNETWTRRWFPWTRVKPSTPVAAAPVVIMNNTIEKEDMELFVRDAFASRNINPKRTKIGRDVIFRKGDPTNNHDLVRVAAHKATSIVVMMTEGDEEGLEMSDGVNENSATIRTVLALRNLMFSNGNPLETFPDKLRVVVQLSSSCPFLSASAFVTPWGKPCLFAQDVGKNVNRLLFKCSSDPGLASVLVQLLGFNGKAIKCRAASELRAGPNYEVGWFVGKAMGDALLQHGWSNAQLIGSDDDKIGEFDGGDSDGLYNEPGSPGVMGDPARIISAFDTMIYVCESSTPSFGGPSLNVTSFDNEAKAFIGNATTSREPVSADAKKPQHMLLCGWRPEWTKQPERFKSRLHDVRKGLPVGSVVTCANLMDAGEFALIMTGAKVGFQAVESPNGCKRFSGYGGDLLVDHHEGDPSNYTGMQALFKTFPNGVDTALVLGTMVTVNLPGAARDARVLSILLILRKIATELGMHGMHAIAENEQDQTAMLAVCPQTPSMSGLPDFVNTQQIIARSLAMNLAYPQIVDAVSEIVMPAGPGIEFIASQHLGITGEKVSYGAVMNIIVETYGGRGIPIGYMYGPSMVLGPEMGAKIEWTADHRIICFIRRMPTTKNFRASLSTL